MISWTLGIGCLSGESCGLTPYSLCTDVRSHISFLHKQRVKHRMSGISPSTPVQSNPLNSLSFPHIKA